MTGKINWTPEMDAAVANLNGRLLKQVAAALGVSEWSAWNRRRLLADGGAKVVNLRRRWTPEEDDLIMAASYTEARAMAAAIGRTPSAINRRRVVLRARLEGVIAERLHTAWADAWRDFEHVAPSADHGDTDAA